MTAPARESDVLHALVRFLSENFPDIGEELSPDTTLPDHVLIDSLAYMEVLMFLETRFGASFEARDLDAAHFQSPATVAALTISRLGQAR